MATSTYNNVLEELKRINKETTFDAYVPSGNKSHQFRPLSIKDQKQIIKTAIDPTATNIQYSINMNNVIMNSTEYTNLLTIDKPAILVALRCNSLGKELKITDDEDESKTVTVDLEQVVSRYPDTVNSEKYTSLIQYKSRFQHEGITMSVRIPDLDTDTKFLKECAGKIKKIKDAGESISELYVYELAKYIESVQFKTTTEDLSGNPTSTVNTVRFDTLPASECIEVVELLPMSINTKLVSYVTNTRDAENLFRNTTIDGEEYEIPLDATLFALE